MLQRWENTSSTPSGKVKIKNDVAFNMVVNVKTLLYKMPSYKKILLYDLILTKKWTMRGMLNWGSKKMTRYFEQW
jgi:hypothetical protein